MNFQLFLILKRELQIYMHEPATPMKLRRMNETVNLEKSIPSIKIVNIVMTGTLDRAVDLESIAKVFQDRVSYNSDAHFAAFKSGEMSRKVLIFPWGGMISGGTACKEEAERDLLSVARSLETAGIASLKGIPLVQNIVAVVDFHTQFDLANVVDMAKKLNGATVIYEPEQFPALIVHMPSSKGANIVVQLFSSGKAICVGSKRLEDVYKVIERIKKTLLSDC